MLPSSAFEKIVSRILQILPSDQKEYFFELLERDPEGARMVIESVLNRLHAISDNNLEALDKINLAEQKTIEDILKHLS